MGRRSFLEIVLGGVFGVALGGIITVSLLFSGIGHWVVWVPVFVGGLGGLWRGDRALHGMVRVLELFS